MQPRSRLLVLGLLSNCLSAQAHDECILLLQHRELVRESSIVNHDVVLIFPVGNVEHPGPKRLHMHVTPKFVSKETTQRLIQLVADRKSVV